MVHLVYNKFELSNCKILSEMLLPSQSQSYIYFILNMSYNKCHLFNVVPDEPSLILGYIIKTFFVINGETKLNNDMSH